MNAPTNQPSIDLVRACDRAPEAEQRRLETHVLVRVLPRAAAYAISSDFHPEYAARASEDVPAAMLRLWQEICQFMAEPEETRASEITKLMRQILNAQRRQREASALDLAIRQAVRMANNTERERTLLERLSKQRERADEFD